MSINVASQLAVQAIQNNYLIKQLIKETIGKPITDYWASYIYNRIRSLQYDLQNRYDIKNCNLIKFKVVATSKGFNIRTNLEELLKVNKVEESTANQIIGLLLS